MKIIDIKSRQILDSRGFPTIETDVYVKTGLEEQVFQVEHQQEVGRL